MCFTFDKYDPFRKALTEIMLGKPMVTTVNLGSSSILFKLLTELWEVFLFVCLFSRTLI